MKLIHALLITGALILGTAGPAVAQEVQPDPSTEQAAQDPVPHKTCYDSSGFPFQTYVEFEPCQTEAPTTEPVVVTCYTLENGVVYPFLTGKAEAEATGCSQTPPEVLVPDEALLSAQAAPAALVQEGNGEGHDPVTVCHKPGTPAQQELTFDDDGWEAHINHGDTEGPCPVEIEVDPEDVCGAPDWTQEQRDAFRDAILVLVNNGADLGAPPCGVIEECGVGVDPIEDIIVTLSNLIIDGEPYTEDFGPSETYDGATPNHLANFDLTGTVFGVHTISVDATWNIGTGVLTITGDVDCPPEPCPEGTFGESVPDCTPPCPFNSDIPADDEKCPEPCPTDDSIPVTDEACVEEPPTTTTTQPPVVTTPTTATAVPVVTQTPPPAQPKDDLPFTGAEVAGLLAVGSGAAGVGTLLARLRRRR
jgi:hypothetical protein